MILDYFFQQKVLSIGLRKENQDITWLIVSITWKSIQKKIWSLSLYETYINLIEMPRRLEASRILGDQHNIK